MVMGGGLGLGGIQTLAYKLIKWKEKINILIFTGRNERLRRNFLKNEVYHHPNIQIIGFVNILTNGWKQQISSSQNLVA